MPRPQTPGYNTTNIFIPVPPNPNFLRHPEVNEKTALVMNVVVPQHPRLEGEKFPVLAWIHGGSLLFGSANYGIYNAVNLVSHSVEIGWPVVVASFNYRLGLGGFLASAKIGEELKADGFEGNGNFGFTDQKLQWTGFKHTSVSLEATQTASLSLASQQVVSRLAIRWQRTIQ